MAETKITRPTFATKAIPSDVNNANFTGNPVVDNLVSSMVAMGAEVWSTKRRMMVLESVLAKKGVTSEMIEKYMATDAQSEAWAKERDRFIELTFGPLANDGTVGVAAAFPKRG